MRQPAPREARDLTLVTTPLASSPSTSLALSPFAPPVLTSSAQKRRLARQAQRGITLEPLAPIETSPSVDRTRVTPSKDIHQPVRHSPTATTAPLDESSAELNVKLSAAATPMHGQGTAAPPSSCRRFRFADAHEHSMLASPPHQPHPISGLSHGSPLAVCEAPVDGRVQRLEERCRELEEARRRSHAAWMEELSSQALIKQQLTAQRQAIDELEAREEALTQQRDAHASHVQRLQAEVAASAQKQLSEGGRHAVLRDQHNFLEEVSVQQAAAITALKAEVAAGEQQLSVLQSCLEAERRRYEELRSGVDGSIESGQQLRTALEATQAELQAVLQDKEQLIQHMDALEKQADEATSREQLRATQDREANKRSETVRKQLIDKWEDSESERQQLSQQVMQLQADVVHWQHKHQNEADSHTALQHKHALALSTAVTSNSAHLSSPTSAASSVRVGEHKEERVSRLAAVRRQLTEMRDNISARLAAIRPVKRKDERLLALQAELERSEAEMERLLKEHEATWQQVNRVRRERCLSCGGFHNGASTGGEQREAGQQLNESVVHDVPVRDTLLSDMTAFNQRLQAENAALREKVESLLKERNDALEQVERRQSAGGSAKSAVANSSGKNRGSRRVKRARDGAAEDKENDNVLQPMDTNGVSSDRDRKHRRSTTATGRASD